MEIIFRQKAGEIYSLFTSLYFSWNVNALEHHVGLFGITLKEELKEEYYHINEIHKNKKETMDFFFNKESEIFRFFIVFDKIWESKSIDEYISFIQDMSEHSLRVMLVKILIDNKLKNDDERIESIALNKETVLNFVKELDINKTSKWDLYCFVDNMERYKQSFITLIKDYTPTFNKLLNKQRVFIDEVNTHIMRRINAEGVDFIKEYINNFIILDEFKKIFITNSYFDSYLIYFTLTNNTENCYLVVGPYYQEIGAQNDYLEMQLKVLKNLSDKTRFGIMKYILEDERYGQEIADKFNISNASVSYHMNNLLFLNLVKISKQDNKVFYKLNKERISEIIKFLEDELCL